MKVERDPRRVVIDTKVWISAALSHSGAPAQVVSRVLQRGVAVLAEQRKPLLDEQARQNLCGAAQYQRR